MFLPLIILLSNQYEMLYRNSTTYKATILFSIKAYYDGAKTKR
jgi:hypothetical protein